MAQVPYTTVDIETVKSASYCDNNTFKVDELVITEAMRDENYMYSVITRSYLSDICGQQILMFEVVRNFPFPNYRVAFSAGDIGKINKNKL